MEKTFNKLMNNKPTPQMPIVFVGHGSPMHAIMEDSFSSMLAGLGRSLPKPETILCISAHWMTEGVWVTHMKNPRTIHDFSNFPQALFDIQYPSPGSPKMAEEVSGLTTKPRIVLDNEMWGIDHGTWSVLKHMYPHADIPVIQLSLYMSKPSDFHFQLGQYLKPLRSRGVLILGSGNIVHNLGIRSHDMNAKPYDWAVEFDEWVKTCVENRDFASLVNNHLATSAGRLSIPSADHWYPLLYTLGAFDEKDRLQMEFEGIEHASISMRCFTFGRD